MDRGGEGEGTGYGGRVPISRANPAKSQGPTLQRRLTESAKWERTEKDFSSLCAVPMTDHEKIKASGGCGGRDDTE